MREIAAKKVGGKNSGRAALAIGVAAVLALAEWSCGSGGRAGSVAGPQVGEEDPPAPTSVAGTWRGGSASLNVFWRLTQQGESVTGSGQISGDDGWADREGRVVGSVSGSNFTFNHIHSVATPSQASCIAELQGTLQFRIIPAPTQTPRPPYPPEYPIIPPSKPLRASMSGAVEGSACGRPFRGTITLFRE